MNLDHYLPCINQLNLKPLQPILVDSFPHIKFCTYESIFDIAFFAVYKMLYIRQFFKIKSKRT